MIPEEPKTGIGIDSDEGHCNESEEHLEHGEQGGFIENILSSAFVDEFKHFMSGDMSVSVADAPLETLQVYLLFDFAHYSHVGLRNDQVGSTSEAELLVDAHNLVVVGHLGEKGGVGVYVDRSNSFVQIYHVLILGEQFAELWLNYSQKRQVLAVK